MKVLYLFFILCILGVYAQRRPTKPDTTNLEASSQRTVSRGRGRTRFAVTPEFEQINADYEEVTKSVRKADVPRRKLESAKATEKRGPPRAKEVIPKTRTYEVKEVIDDIPREDSRRTNKKPRVVTESRYEAANIPKKELFTPASSSEPDELAPNLPSFVTPSESESIAEETALPAQLTTVPMNSIVSTEKSTSESEASLKDTETLDTFSISESPAADTEIKRKQTEVPIPHKKVPESRRGSPPVRAGRTRGTTVSRVDDPATPAPRARIRTTRPPRRQEEPSPSVAVAPSLRSNFRTGRRRGEAVAAESSQEPVKARGPSVFSAENAQELPSRARTGRRVTSASERRLEQRNGSDEVRTSGRGRNGRTNSNSRSTQRTTTISEPEKIDLIPTRRDSVRTSQPTAAPNAPEKIELISTRRGSSRTAQASTTAYTNSVENVEVIPTPRDSHVRTTPSTTTTTSAPEKIDLISTRRDSSRTTQTTASTDTLEKADAVSSRRDTTRRTQSSTVAPERKESASPRRDSRRGGRLTEPSVERPASSRSSSRERTTQVTETRSQRRGSSRATVSDKPEVTVPAGRQSRGRSRSSSFLTLNEQQLEVLPLFETEPKTVVHNVDSVTVPTRGSLGRRRSLNAAEDIAISSTKQTEIKLKVDPTVETLSSSTQSSIKVSRQQSISIETKTEKAIRKVNKKRPTYPRSKPTSKSLPPLSESKENQVKESVSVSEVTEVTSARKFVPHNTRKNRLGASSKAETTKDDEKDKINASGEPKTSVKVDEPKVSVRQVVRTQKLPSKLSKGKVSGELTSSQEDIGETDNYPLPYKAAIIAKKNKKEGLGSRSNNANEVSITKTTEKAVTSSTASTSPESSASPEATDIENIVNKDEEINHKSETESTTLTPSTKFPRPRFSLTTRHPRSNDNKLFEATNKTESNRPGFSRKYKPGKSKPSSTTQGSSEDDEDSATTTPSPLQKFHARFKSSRNSKDIVVTPRIAHKSRSYSPKAPKGVYSSRKFTRSSTTAPDTVGETVKPKPRKFNVETSALSTKIPPAGQAIKKSSRFSSRYRSDILSRSGSHRTSTTVPVYVPTVPTVTPPPTSVKIEENELGMEIISFDDPVANTVPSANLISGDYLSSSTDKTESSTPSTITDPSSVVTINTNSESAKVTITKINSFAKEPKDTAAQTTEKPVSIIERIINSITAISTTATPDSGTKTSTSTNGQSTKSSAILNLVSKRPKDNSIDITLEQPSAQKHTRSPNSVDYRTTEKPTTIIEKILSSLSAIRADTAESTTVDPMQVGSSYNTIDTTPRLSSTESISKIAAATTPMSKETPLPLPLISDSTTSSASTASSFSTGSSTLGFETISTLIPSGDLSTIPIGTSSITPRSVTITTPLSAQTTPTLSPTNFIDEISSEQTLPKRTIDKLLTLLNIVSPTTTTAEPTTTKLIIVTPKLTTFITTNTEPINTEPNATPIPTTLPTVADATTATISQSSSFLDSTTATTPQPPSTSNSASTTTPQPPSTSNSASATTPQFLSSTDSTTVTTPQPSSSSDGTTPMLFTSTFVTPPDISSNEVNLSPNPLAASEPTIGSRILDVIATISRMMSSTVSPSTTDFSTSTPTTPIASTTGSVTTGTPAGSSNTAAAGTTPFASTAGSVTTGTSAGSTNTAATGTPIALALSTTANPTSSGNTATPTTVTAGTPGVATTPIASTTPAVATTFGATQTPEAAATTATSTLIPITTPTATVTPTVTTQPSTPGVATTVTESGTPTVSVNPLANTDSSASTFNPTTSQTGAPLTSLPTTVTSSTAGISTTASSSTAGISTTVPSLTTTQGTTSTEVSVVQGSISNVTPASPTSTTITIPSTTQTASTLLTTANTTPTLTSTTDTLILLSTTPQQTGTSTTGSSFITSTPKFTRETTTDSTFDVPSTLPTLANFEVSPDRVRVYSANDISSTFTPDDPATTISIAARAFLPGSTFSTTTEVTGGNTVLPTQSILSTPQPTVGTTGVSSTMVASTLQSTIASTTTVAAPTTNSITTTVSSSNNIATTIPSVMTTINVNTANNKLDATTQDVSSNTIDTNSVTDKQPQVNQTDASNLVNPLSTNDTVLENRSMSPGSNVSPAPLINKTTTITMTVMDRDGKVSQFEANPLQNDISTEPRNKDYFIFAVLPNNTILRKRPSKYPNKDTPFLIYGVLPNNTLVQKFPNGSIVPMEPVIQVIGFDTRDNPPPPPEITSNQVTSDQDSRPDNNKVSTADVAQNTVPSSVDANQLSTNGAAITTTQPPLPPLTELLGGRTVTAFNSIVNRTNGDSQTPKVQTLDVDPLIQLRGKVDNIELNTISSASSAGPSSPAPSSTDAPFTTPLPLSFTTAASVATTTAKPTTTVQPTTTGAPATTPRPTTRVPTTTFFPAFLTTLLSTIQPRTRISTTVPTTAVPTTVPPPPPTTVAPATTTSAPLTTIPARVTTTAAPVTTTFAPVTTTSTPFTTTPAVLFTSPISRTVSVSPNALSADVSVEGPPTNLLDLLSKGAVSSTPLPTTVLSTTIASLKNINLKQRQLTEQQKHDLATLEALEREQAAILQQLAFLTGLNVGNVNPPTGKDNLADRVLATAMDKLKGTNGKGSSSTNTPPPINLLETLSPKDSRQSKSIAVPSVEELVKQINANGLNSVTPPGPIVTSTYGKSNEALLASLLKEYGVGPTTPELLSAVFNQEIRTTTSVPKATTTKRSTTTQAPGRFMQGLNWLLNALAPPPSTKRPQPKPKPKARPLSIDDELLNKQPTEISPVIVEPDESRTETNVISQDQLVSLIKQLEEIQKDPKKAQNLDIEALKNLQNANGKSSKSSVQVINTSSTGATARTFISTTDAPFVSSPKSAISDNEIKPLITNRGGIGQSTTISLSSVDLKEVPGVAADLESATTRTKIPPVKLNPVPGVPDDNPRVRGQLVSYAINVTKAISSFLGSALQGASNRFVNALSTGSGSLSHLFNSSSINTGNILSASSSSP